MPVQQPHQPLGMPRLCPIVRGRQRDPEDIRHHAGRMPLAERQDTQGTAAEISVAVVVGKFLQSQALGFCKFKGRQHIKLMCQLKTLSLNYVFKTVICLYLFSCWLAPNTRLFFTELTGLLAIKGSHLF